MTEQTPPTPAPDPTPTPPSRRLEAPTQQFAPVDTQPVGKDIPLDADDTRGRHFGAIVRSPVDADPRRDPRSSAARSPARWPSAPRSAAAAGGAAFLLRPDHRLADGLGPRRVRLLQGLRQGPRASDLRGARVAAADDPAASPRRRPLHHPRAARHPPRRRAGHPRPLHLRGHDHRQRGQPLHHLHALHDRLDARCRSSREFMHELYAQRRVGFRFLDGAEDVFRKRQRVEHESEAVDKAYEIFCGADDDMNRARQVLSPQFLVWLERPLARGLRLRVRRPGSWSATSRATRSRRPSSTSSAPAPRRSPSACAKKRSSSAGVQRSQARGGACR